MQRTDSLEKSLMLWRLKEKGTTEDEMVGWHHCLDGHEFELTPESVMDREAWRAAVHGVRKGQTRLSNWTELNPLEGISAGALVLWDSPKCSCTMGFPQVLLGLHYLPSPEAMECGSPSKGPSAFQLQIPLLLTTKMLSPLGHEGSQTPSFILCKLPNCQILALDMQSKPWRHFVLKFTLKKFYLVIKQNYPLWISKLSFMSQKAQSQNSVTKNLSLCFLQLVCIWGKMELPRRKKKKWLGF